ncbi:hypothetical protein PAMP_013774 [Pampus punctatissimus]
MLQSFSRPICLRIPLLCLSLPLLIVQREGRQEDVDGAHTAVCGASATESDLTSPRDCPVGDKVTSWSATWGELPEGSKQFILELSALIVVKFSWITKPWDKVVENPVCSSFACLLSGGICLCKPGKVVDDYQNVFISTTAGFKGKEVFLLSSL